MVSSILLSSTIHAHDQALSLHGLAFIETTNHFKLFDVASSLSDMFSPLCLYS
jgi:hypothetical protein